jgi:hypothetical protein
MDAAYYTLGAQRLAQGHGFTEMLLWNYLDDPAGLPHPSHLYWMPLPSVLAAMPMFVLGTDYHAAQWPFVLLAALIPPLAYAWSWQLAHSRRQALVAGGLALFSGYYVAFLGARSSRHTLAGAVCLAASGLALRDGRPGWYALAGAAAALGHLARADGVLLLAPVVLGAIVAWRRGATAAEGRRPRLSGLQMPAVALAAYLAVMAPWFARNWAVAGAPLPGAGTVTLWLRDYDQLFSYGQLPTAAAYLAWGWAISSRRSSTPSANLLTFVAVNNLVLLTPSHRRGAARHAGLAGAGLWRVNVRGNLRIRPGRAAGRCTRAARCCRRYGRRGAGLTPLLRSLATEHVARERAQVSSRWAWCGAAGLSAWLHTTRAGPGGWATAWNQADRA